MLFSGSKAGKYICMHVELRIWSLELLGKFVGISANVCSLEHVSINVRWAGLLLPLHLTVNFIVDFYFIIGITRKNPRPLQKHTQPPTSLTVLPSVTIGGSVSKSPVSSASGQLCWRACWACWCFWVACRRGLVTFSLGFWESFRQLWRCFNSFPKSTEPIKAKYGSAYWMVCTGVY